MAAATPVVLTASRSGSGTSGVRSSVQPSNTKQKKTITPPVEVVVLDQDGDPVTSQEIEVKLDLMGNRHGRLKGGSR